MYGIKPVDQIETNKIVELLEFKQLNFTALVLKLWIDLRVTTNMINFVV